VCECDEGWAGGDCSVPLNATTCLEGSRRSVDRPDQHGTCWQQCECKSNATDCRHVCGWGTPCKLAVRQAPPLATHPPTAPPTRSFGTACADFTCQPGLRRQGSQDSCVRDNCTKDDFTADQDQVCLRNCTCPADGGPCILAKDCSIRIGIGGGRHGVGGGALLAWMATCLALGGGAALAYIHYRGIPPWLPIRERGYVGMYM
jgi:hypothetical protein